MSQRVFGQRIKTLLTRLRLYFRKKLHNLGYCHWVDKKLFHGYGILTGQECSVCSKRRQVWTSKNSRYIPTPYDECVQDANNWVKEVEI